MNENQEEIDDDRFPLLELDDNLLNEVVLRYIQPYPHWRPRRTRGPPMLGLKGVHEDRSFLERVLRPLLNTSPSLFLRIVRLGSPYTSLFQHTSTHTGEWGTGTGTGGRTYPTQFCNKQLFFLARRSPLRPSLEFDLSTEPMGALILELPQFTFGIASSGQRSTASDPLLLPADQIDQITSLSSLCSLLPPSPSVDLVSVVYVKPPVLTAPPTELAEDLTTFLTLPGSNSNSIPLRTKTLALDWNSALALTSPSSSSSSFPLAFISCSALAIASPSTRDVDERLALDALPKLLASPLFLANKLTRLHLDFGRTPGASDVPLFKTLAPLAPSLETFYLRGDTDVSNRFCLDGLPAFTALRELELRIDSLAFREDAPLSSASLVESFKELEALTSLHINQRYYLATDVIAPEGGPCAYLPHLLPNLRNYYVNDHVSHPLFCSLLPAALEDIVIERLDAPIFNEGWGAEGTGWNLEMGAHFNAPQLTALTRLEIGLLGYHPSLPLRTLERLLDLRVAHHDTSYRSGGERRNLARPPRYYGIGSAAFSLELPPSLTSLHLRGLESLLPDDWHGDSFFRDLSASLPLLRNLLVDCHAFLSFTEILPGLRHMTQLRALAVQGNLAIPGRLSEPLAEETVLRFITPFVQAVASLPRLDFFMIENFEVLFLSGRGGTNFDLGGLPREEAVLHAMEAALNFKCNGGPFLAPGALAPSFTPLPEEEARALRAFAETAWLPIPERFASALLPTSSVEALAPTPTTFLPFGALAALGMRPALSSEEGIEAFSTVHMAWSDSGVKDAVGVLKQALGEAFASSSSRGARRLDVMESEQGHRVEAADRFGLNPGDSTNTVLVVAKRP